MAGAAVAATAAGSAAATGAGLGAAVGVGTAAAAASIGGAGTAALTIGGAAAFGATAGAGVGGSALTVGAIAAEVLALVGVASSVYSYKQEQKDAAQARRTARDVASMESAQAGDEASRQMRVLAEEKAGAVIKNAAMRGEAKNLLNRGSMQIAALTREVDRTTQQATSLIDTRIKALEADRVKQIGRANFKMATAFKQNKGPSKLSLGLSLGSSLVGSVAGGVGGALGKVGQLGAAAGSTAAGYV